MIFSQKIPPKNLEIRFFFFFKNPAHHKVKKCNYPCRSAPTLLLLLSVRFWRKIESDKPNRSSVIRGDNDHSVWTQYQLGLGHQSSDAPGCHRHHHHHCRHHHRDHLWLHRPCYLYLYLCHHNLDHQIHHLCCMLNYMIPVKANDHPTELAAPKVFDVTAFCQVLIHRLFLVIIGDALSIGK